MKDDRRRLQATICKVELATVCLLTCAACQESAVANTGPVALVSSTPLWNVAERWSVGEVQTVIGRADFEEPLYEVSAATRVQPNRIAIADASNYVRIFDLQGRRVSLLGGPGQGPGEFQGIDALRVLRDTLWVADGWAGRVAGFSLGGKLLASYDMRAVQAMTQTHALGFFHDGDLLIQRIRLARPQGGDVPRGGPIEPDTLEWYRYFREEGLLRLLGVGQHRESHGIPWGDGFIRGEPVFGARTEAAGSDDHLMVSRLGEPFRIERIGRDGEVSLRFGRTYDSRRPTEADREAYVQFRLSLVSGSIDVDAWRRYFDDAPLRDRFPAVAEVLVDRTGATWARHFGPPGEAVVWSVFDTAGRWLGEVLLPDVVQLMEVGEDYVIALERDSLQVETVSLRNLVRPRSPASS